MINKLLIIGLSSAIFLYLLYVKSIYRVEYEFNTQLPKTADVISIENGWTWVPQLKNWTNERTLTYLLIAESDDFKDYILNLENCLECSIKTISEGQNFSIFPVDNGDVKNIVIQEITENKVIFKYSLNYN